MSDEQIPPANEKENSEVTGAETLALPREEAEKSAPATDADAKADDLSAEELEAATAPDLKETAAPAPAPEEIAEPSADIVNRNSKRTAS